MSEQKKKITLEDLAVTIKESEKRIIKYIDTKIDTKIDELAIMTKRGFDGVSNQFNKMDERFDKMDEKLDDLDKSNNQAHENTSLRLNEACPVK
ncbi:MAG: hypothetical protein V1732_02365 [Patescibacteria group bacterium]